MERRLKERLIGAAVLVMIAVIFIPMILDDSIQDESEITGTNIPQRPEDGSGSSIVPDQAPDIKEIPPLLTGETNMENVGEPDKHTGDAAVPEKITGAVAKPETGGVTAEPDKETQKTAAAPEKAITPAPQDSPSRTETEKKGLTAWVVQLGSFSSRENADKLSEKLRHAGYAAFVEPIKTGSETAYRVRVGPELLRSDAQVLQKKIDKQFQQKGIVLRYP